MSDIKSIAKVSVWAAAYCVFDFWNYTPYWYYGNVWGRCFDCDDRLIKERLRLYAKITFNRFATAADEAIAKSLSPFDMRTLKDIKEGCCPPRLMSELLRLDATAGEPLD
jgi:hypothetical protein